MNPTGDTIVAIATPLGEGGISVIRLSGNKAIEITAQCYRGKTNLHAVSSHTAHYGTICGEDGEIVDEGIVTIFRRPHSYTGEDVVEISCHGGAYIAHKIMDAIVKQGVRLADPGEFTKRAFLNGKMDLSQAEAVADLIQSKSEVFYRAALNQLRGNLSLQISNLRGKLISLSGLLELDLDFSEEDLVIVTRAKIEEDLNEIAQWIGKLMNTYREGRVAREGLRVVFTGGTNVGKSSIFNYLVNDNRAIITAIPGTTRDTLFETVVLGGVPFILADTAGLRKSDDIIEREGIKRTYNEIDKADIIVVVLDANEGDGEKNKKNKEEINSIIRNDQTVVVAMNKVDLIAKTYQASLTSNEEIYPLVMTSTVTGEGMEDLKNAIRRVAEKYIHLRKYNEPLIINLRHYECLRRAKVSLVRAKEAITRGLSNEFVAIDTRAAYSILGEIIGEVRDEDVLNGIFSKFCIGK